MKFNAVAAAVLLAGNVYADADDAQKVVKDDAEASTVSPPIATFTVSFRPTLLYCTPVYGLETIRSRPN